MKVSKYFTREEFQCKCGCKIYNVNPVLLATLDDAREEAGIPFIILSGCRCAKHNSEVGGKEDSAHLTGKIEQCEAADIKAETSQIMFKIVESLFDDGCARRIGINFDKIFVHVDVDSTKPQDVLFHY